MFSEANKTLNSYLKQLVNEGKIAGTVHKNPLTSEIIQKLYDVGELADADTRDPRALLQTAWFIVSIYFGKRGKENQSSLKKSMLRLVPAANGEEFFELNRNEPGAVFASKNHTGGLDGSEDPSDGKIFPQASSRRCPVELLKAYLSHLNPNSDALFQLLNRKTSAPPSLTLTNHSLRATTVTVLSPSSMEKKVHQLLMQSQDFKVPHLQFPHSIPQAIKDHC